MANVVPLFRMIAPHSPRGDAFAFVRCIERTNLLESADERLSFTFLCCSGKDENDYTGESQMGKVMRSLPAVDQRSDLKSFINIPGISDTACDNYVLLYLTRSLH